MLSVSLSPRYVPSPRPKVEVAWYTRLVPFEIRMVEDAPMVESPVPPLPMARAEASVSTPAESKLLVAVEPKAAMVSTERFVVDAFTVVIAVSPVSVVSRFTVEPELFRLVPAVSKKLLLALEKFARLLSTTKSSVPSESW